MTTPVPNAKSDNRRWVLQEIQRDTEAEVERLGRFGHAMGGRTVAECLLPLAAAIKTLAAIVETLVPDDSDFPAGAVAGHQIGGEA